MTPTKLDAAAALERMDSMDAAQTLPPAFDYSELDKYTVDDLHFAEKEYQHGRQMAERGLMHMSDAIAVAHEALVANCDKHNNQNCENNFKAWCASIGITKDTAYRLLQVADLMDHSNPRQQKVLKELSPSLLYAVAKPSAPAELVKKVKDGEITTHKAYQDLLKENQQLRTDRVNAMNRAERAESRAHDAETRLKNSCIAEQNAQEALQAAESARDAAIADVNGLMEQNTQLRKDYNTANEDRIAANLQRQKAEAQRDKAEAHARDVENQLEGSRKVVEAARLRGDKLKAEVDSLKSQPSVAVIDKDEVERRAKELADAQVAEFKAQMEQQAGPSEEDGRQAYDSIIMAGRSVTSIWMAVKPLISKIPPNLRTFALNQLTLPAKHILEEAEKCL